MKIIHNINKAERITKSDSCPTLCASNSVPSSPSQAGVVAQCVPLPGHRSVSTNGTEMGRAVPQRVAAMWWAAAVFWLQILLLPQRSSLLDCSRGNRYVSGFRTGSKQKLEGKKPQRIPAGEKGDAFLSRVRFRDVWSSSEVSSCWDGCCASCHQLDWFYSGLP